MTPPSKEVLEYHSQFRSAVIARARGHVDGTNGDEVAFREEAFTELFVYALAEIGQVTEGHVVHFEKRTSAGIARVDGYYIDEDEDSDRLDLFVSIYEGGEEPQTIARTQIERAVKQALNFLDMVAKGGIARMEQADPAFGMVHRIHEMGPHLRELRLFVLTDGIAREFRRSKGLKLKKTHTVQVWDIERLGRSVATGGATESIEVDFVKEFGSPLPCLPVTIPGARYQSYVAVVRGDVLQRLYEDYGERLLEMNVRSFLQARGKINKEIRRTILDEPEQFFAYNNGITAIAEEVGTVAMGTGGTGIVRLRGLQIVNGGQTTASLHRAVKKDGAGHQMASVFIQVRLSVIAPDLVSEMVPRISLYANSQNRVTEADFSANDPFHQHLERLSRSIWSPDGQTHWFYERARGQYQVARTREGRTGAAQKKFDAINPSQQVINKTDLAMFEHSWSHLPHLVSKGSQKNFREFTIRQSESTEKTTPDDEFFKQTVAKGIVFKTMQQVARAAGIAAYRANVVTYSVAYISHRFARKLDLRTIWERQAVSPEVRRAMEILAPAISAAIVDTAGTRNVTEWCKKPECWSAIKQRDLLPRIQERA